MKNTSKHFERIIRMRLNVYSITEYTRTEVPGWEWDDWFEQYYWGTVYETKEVKHALITREPIWWLTERGKTMFTDGHGTFSEHPFMYTHERITKVW